VEKVEVLEELPEEKKPTPSAGIPVPVPIQQQQQQPAGPGEIVEMNGVKMSVGDSDKERAPMPDAPTGPVTTDAAPATT
jgi:hypothetical protein